MRNNKQPRMLGQLIACFDWHLIRKQLRNNAQIYHPLQFLRNPDFIDCFGAILDLSSGVANSAQNSQFPRSLAFLYNLYSARPDFVNSAQSMNYIFKISTEADLQTIQAILVLLFSQNPSIQKQVAGYFEKSILRLVQYESKQVRQFARSIATLLFELDEPLPGNFYKYKSILANMKRRHEQRGKACREKQDQIQNEFEISVSEISSVIVRGKENNGQSASKYLANYKPDELQEWFYSPLSQDTQNTSKAELIGMIIEGHFAELLQHLPEDENLATVSQFLVEEDEERVLRDKAKGFSKSLYEVLSMDYSKFIHFVETMHEFCVVSNFSDNLFLRKDKIFITTGWILLAVRFQNLSHPNILKEIQILKREILAQIEWVHDSEDPEDIFEILINAYFGRDSEGRKLTQEDRLENMTKLLFKIHFVGFENYREVIGTLVKIMLKMSGGGENLSQKLAQCEEHFSTLFGANPQLVGDLVELLLKWDFDVLARLLDPVVLLNPEILKNQAYSIKQEAEEAAIKERNQDLKRQFQKSGVSDSFYKDLLKKINDGSASYRDLFQLSDQTGNGMISVSQFQRLLARLGIQISEQRTIEIFTSTKKRATGQFEVDLYPAPEQELTEEEFQKAVRYVYSKTEDAALEQMGLSTENLVIIFSTLLVILLLVFVFIFLGIAAFSVGGTFGSIINSIFPILAGVGVSRKKDETEMVDQEKAEQAYQEALLIIQSQK